MALDSAKRNFELPLICGGSRNPELRRSIAETAAAEIAGLGRKVAGTNAGSIKPETDDLIVIEYKDIRRPSLEVNARINLETAIVGRVLAQLSVGGDKKISRWYASLARAAKSSARIRG